ncbi:hypothetical protein [Streptomyces sp. IB2014 016-6]|nr:hypothetical protein [Streptomyces sp. IB2014 016-6]
MTEPYGVRVLPEPSRTTNGKILRREPRSRQETAPNATAPNTAAADTAAS